MKISREALIQLHLNGLSYTEIGDMLGISRQRVHQIITNYQSPASRMHIPKGTPKGRPRNEELHKPREVKLNRLGIPRGSIPYTDYKREYQRRFRLVINGKGVAVNKRPRPNSCELCKLAKPRLNYHHWDDGKPHLGIWVCGRCHAFITLLGLGFEPRYSELKYQVEKENLVN